MKTFSSSPSELLASFWRNRLLIKALTKREILGRYKGSSLGLVWALFNPIVMLGVYTFVFSYVFKGRWISGTDSKTEFALVLFCGLLVFNLFAECINRAPLLVVNNTNYVKRVVFPLEILSWVTLGAALFHFLLSLLVWLAAYSIGFGLPHATVWFLPLILLPLSLFVMGLSWSLASLGVYVRDVGQVMGMVVSVMMFLTPIFYPTSVLPEKYRPFLYLNPLTPAVEMMRDVMYWGKPPDLAMLGFYLVATSMMAWLGFAWFQKTRKGFADVL
jgi:lipopolysaccharide transport system permease protein